MNRLSVGRHAVLVEAAEGYEVAEAPVYRGSRGPLFKTLLSTGCRMDCRYCPFSRLCRYPRERWRPEKLVRVFLAAYRAGLVRGLFLSSGIYNDPERVSEDVISVAEELRRRGYRGYIHLRLMPGTPGHLVRRALEVADRVGINLEAPGPSHFSEIAPSKGSWSLDIYSRLALAARLAGDPRRVDTQLMVGASGESDEETLTLLARLSRDGIGVVHFSPYQPVPGTPLAERVRRPAPQWRARLLYEAWSLIRSRAVDLDAFDPLLDAEGMLPRPPRGKSLKEMLADAHPEWFPVDPSTAGRTMLLRVPGIGVKTADAIMRLRERGLLSLEALRRLLGPRWRRASRFLDLTGLPRSSPSLPALEEAEPPGGAVEEDSEPVKDLPPGEPLAPAV